MDETSRKPEETSCREELSVLIGEYNALKSEQRSRIGFRDNLLYVTVGAAGGVTSVALGGFGKSGPMLEALLVIPWVTVILGWTYLVNDEKITAIRMYVEDDLAKRIRRLVKMRQAPFSWEKFHRGDGRQKIRKRFQLVVDLITFVFSGAAALVAYGVHMFHEKPGWPLGVAVVVEAGLLLVLALQFVDHAKEASRPRRR